jgi:chromosome segregation ATPase
VLALQELPALARAVSSGWTSIDECRRRFRELDVEAKRLGALAERAADHIIELEAALSRTAAELAEAERLLAETRQERDSANQTARRLLAEVERLQREGRA